MTGTRGGGGLEDVSQAATRARERLATQMEAESERLDRELAELSERMLERALRVTEERVDGELVRLRDVSAELRAETESSLARIREELGAELRERVSATVETAMAEFAGRAVGPRRDLIASPAEAPRAAGPQVSSAEIKDRLDEVLSRLRAAEGRLHDSDERIRSALRHLRAVPDEG